MMACQRGVAGQQGCAELVKCANWPMVLPAAPQDSRESRRFVLGGMPLNAEGTRWRRAFRVSVALHSLVVAGGGWLKSGS